MCGEKNEIEEVKDVKENKTSAGWKNVAIGGVAGIMFGAGTAYAASKLAEGDEPTAEGGHSKTGGGAHDVSLDSSDVADVKAGQSFSEAFADARAQVGPGGVFRWHDGVYGTYLKDEWDAMSPEEQQLFTKNAMNAAKDAGNGSAMHVNTGEEHVGSNDENNDLTAHTEPNVTDPTLESPSDTTLESDPKPTFAVNNNVNVHVVGAPDDQLAYNNSVTVEQPTGEGTESDVLVVNLENDNTSGVETSELYNCCQVEEEATTDIPTIDADESNVDMNMNLYTSNDITSDMSDCMNDVDMQLV